jgi:RNA polymerase sigma-70 factor (subfamily 1)
MPRSPDACSRLLEEFRAYLETLTFIQIDPRLRSKFSMSDLVQNTLLEAWPQVEQLEALDPAARKRRLRTMLMNNLLDEIDRWRTRGRDVRRERSLEEAAEDSSCRLKLWLAVEGSSPSEHLMRDEQGLRLLEALAKLDPRQREALILQKYHGWTLAQIAEHLRCTIGAVAGLHAHGLKKLRKHLTELGEMGEPDELGMNDV